MASGWNVGAGELRASLGGLGHAPATRAHGPQKGAEVESGEGPQRGPALRQGREGHMGSPRRPRESRSVRASITASRSPADNAGPGTRAIPLEPLEISAPAPLPTSA